MNKINVLTKKQQYSVVILAVAFSLLVVYLAVQGATTISTDITTGGALSVTGASTLTGNVAAGGTLTVTGATYASSTLLVDGATTLASTLAVTSSSTVKSVLNVSGDARLHGAVSASSSLAVAGDTTLSGNLTVTEAVRASSTVANHWNALTLGAGTSTPKSGAKIAAESSGTTTLFLHSSKNSTSGSYGACFQLKGTDGNIYRIYATGTASDATYNGANPAPLYYERGTCNE